MRFLLNHGNIFPLTSLPAYLNLTDLMLFLSLLIAFPRWSYSLQSVTPSPPSKLLKSIKIMSGANTDYQRKSQFATQFMKDLHKLIGIETNLLTAFHPQTDRQTECINQEVEQYLCLFTNHWQTNWNTWLSCGEFSYNNKVHLSTGFSPFFINYRQHPDKGTSLPKDVKS